jgi:outer membrane protein OmpA-like peptidoglycan-associated protein
MIKQIRFLLVLVVIAMNTAFSYGQMQEGSEKLDSILSNNYTLGTVSLNKLVDNLGVHVHSDTVYFASNEKIRSLKQYVNKDNSYTYNLYKAPFNAFNKSQQILIKGSIRTKLNESSPVITKNGNTMYYTGNYTKNDSIANDLNILRATKTNNVWGDIEYLSLNNQGTSNGQGVLNAAETKMYFISNRDAENAHMDIYEVALTKEGVFATPQKLGKAINTDANEIAPFVTANNELYFSSDKQGGYGGFDIYYIDLNNKEAVPINLGSAINSEVDDFSYSIHTSNSKGFLTSNRADGKLKIYTVAEKEPIQKILIDFKKAEAQMKLDRKYQITLNENVIVTPVNFSFPPGENYLNKEGTAFLNYVVNYIKKNSSAILNVNALIEMGILSNDMVNQRIAHVVDAFNKITNYAPNFKIQSKKLESTKKTTIQGIAFYFDGNSYDLSSSNKEELIGIGKQLKADTSMTVVFGTHADSRGTKEYNMLISQKRLEAIRNFYLEIGVSKEQISGNAYGETQLLNKCSNENNCKEEVYRANRRVDYKMGVQNALLK